MTAKTYSVMKGTGSYIPSRCVRNEDFLTHKFYDAGGQRLIKENEDIITKFHEITSIRERRYVSNGLVTSDIATYAASDAIETARIDAESLDYIIVAHNFGEGGYENTHTDIVPSLASRVKYKLKIENPDTVAYDLIFGCPGWLQGVIQADYYIKSGMAKRILVIGAEVLSRVSDPHDIDSMLYADGAGAVILEAKSSDTPVGILGHKTRSDTLLHHDMLHMGKSYAPDDRENGSYFLKMSGHKLYKYALEKVAEAIKSCMEKCEVHLSEIKKVLIHQANGKMDHAILRRLYNLFNIADIPEDMMPMTVEWLGNSSVATLPTLFDRVLKHKLDGFTINNGDTLVFASVGAGMNINALIYRTF